MEMDFEGTNTTWKVTKYWVCILLHSDWIRRGTPYSVRVRENTDQKKLHIWTLFTQCNSANLIKTFKIMSVQNKIDIFFHEIKYLQLISFLCDDILLMIISFLSWWYSVIQQTSSGVNQNYANKWWNPDEKFLLNQ